MSKNRLSIDSSDISEDNQNRSKSFLTPNLAKLQKKYSINENRRETIYEMKLRNHSIDLGPDIFSISNDIISKYREFFKSLGVADDKKAENISVRHWLKINEDKFEEFKKSIIDQQSLDNFYQELDKKKYDFKNSNCGISVGGIKANGCSGFSQKIGKKDDNQRLYIYKYRKICGDGNCFYRAVMFRYLEILVLNNQIEMLKNIAYDVYKSFNSPELNSIVSKIKETKEIKTTLTSLILIIDLLNKEGIISAHKILIKSFGLYRSFDYSIIFYFRYILYDYIKNNENKLYRGFLPLGNLLPIDYGKGNFNFEGFYKKDLLCFYSFAESIVIYITPFVLGISLNVINFDKGNKENQERLNIEGEKGLNLIDEITVVLKNSHYQIVYTENDFKKLYKIYGGQIEEEGSCCSCC